MPAAPSRSARCAEVAGGTAADCAAVCCCCPCGLISFVILAVVRLPAGLCRKAIRKRRKRKKLLTSQQMEPSGDAEVRKNDIELCKTGDSHAPSAGKSPSALVSEMEKEMATRIYGTGFWRSISEREEDS